MARHRSEQQLLTSGRLWGGFEEWVREYWGHKNGYTEGQTAYIWAMLSLTMNHYEGITRTMAEVMDQFDVGFLDTAGKHGDLSMCTQYECMGSVPYDVRASAQDLNTLLSGRNDLEVLLGYSFGGLVVHDYVWGIIHRKVTNSSGYFDVILVQPPIHVDIPVVGWAYGKIVDEHRWSESNLRHPQLSAKEWGGTIICVNEADAKIHGVVWDSVDWTVNDRECGGFLGHCEQGGQARSVMDYLYGN